jgi:putative FmdB family regulatory protein
MPNYDYKCKGCGLVQNKTHPITEDPSLTCPVCSADLARVPSVLAVTFNAKDFYSTSP